MSDDLNTTSLASPRAAAPAVKNETLFCVTGAFEIDEQKVQVVAKTGDDTLVELTRPAKLGNALAIGTWLNNTWKTPVDILLVKKPEEAGGKVASQKDVTLPQVKDNLGSLPDSVKDTVAKLLMANVWITDLYIRRWKNADGEAASTRTAMKFGIMVDMTADGATDGIELLPGIKLLDVGFVVSNAPPKYEFPARKLLPAVEPVKPEKLQEIAAGDEATDSSPAPADPSKRLEDDTTDKPAA